MCIKTLYESDLIVQSGGEADGAIDPLYAFPARRLPRGNRLGHTVNMDPRYAPGHLGRAPAWDQDQLSRD